MDILKFNSFYLVGIKGVAMTSLAQCLLDAGKDIRGSDVEEEFVTQDLLDQAQVKIDFSFSTPLPDQTQALIYTAAHGGPDNPQVLATKKTNIPTFSQAEAMASLFNQKFGVAVCGVGGKSTTSAMITWILWHQQQVKPSFSVGVGNIPGINRTGHWNPASKLFIAEADEYVIDPKAPAKRQKIVPRFSFLQPHITVCTNLRFDHPDVYKNIEHVQKTYLEFFSQIKSPGKLIVNADDAFLSTLKPQENYQIHTFGENLQAQLRLLDFTSQPGTTISALSYQDQKFELQLRVPGKFNVKNALAAILACLQLGVPIAESIHALESFNSTKRRFELIGDKSGVMFYDDYAHHPDEITATLKALREWYPHSRRVIAFQPHTYSRTKELLPEFAQALSGDDEIFLLDIFPSAREEKDPTISSDLLIKKIKRLNPKSKIQNLQTLKRLTDFCQHELHSGDIFITLGAGDIYKVHDKI